MSKTDSTVPAEPWWKFGHVWLVISGPAIVVVAGFVTLYLAITRPDPVVSGYEHGKSVEINKTLAAAHPSSLAPALQARNHAATGLPAAAINQAQKP
jgi:hypothetical protein